jgi:hypothetical protein
MNTRTFLLFIIFTLITDARSVNEPDCDVRSIIVRSIADSSVIRQLSIEQFSARDCSLLVQRMTMIGDDADPSVVSGVVRNIMNAAELYTPERAGPASAMAFQLLKQRSESGDTLTAARAGMIAEFLRPLYVLSKKRSLSALADSVSNSMDQGAFTLAKTLLDTLESRSLLYLNGIAYKDTIQVLRQRLSLLIGTAEHEYALYGQREETRSQYTVSAAVAGVYLPEITGIDWTMITTGPDMVITIEGVRLPATLAFPVGMRFGYSLNSSVAVETELSYSRDTQKDFRVGDYVSPAGFRRTIVTGEVAVKYRLRTTVGLRPYVTVGAAASQLRRSDFHPARKFFDATYIGFTIITPPKEYVIPGQTATATSFIIAIGDELLLSSAEGWVSDFYIGTRISGASNGIMPKSTYMVGFRSGYTW